ncbi:putative RNA-directed DNA polymerase from transposon X-element [Araneus ventricosus]|uniref:Putative RNA-directed DNA polymerase from transposon X-element n=1 Tax=Araneus ventricosus TaxID=182803 RepID=A0A4Y2RBS7_ARAVE|nr:putative RNA-directed DNA polymerase from transposon X-element [Araneus ventricosus]
MLVKNSIPHNELIPPTLTYVEASAVTIHKKNHAPITLISVYVPPPHSADNSIFTFDIEVLLQIGHTPVICGDFNAHHPSWGCTTENSKGRSLSHFVQHAGADIIFPNSPTRYGTFSASTIDLAITKNFLYPFEIHSLPEMSSDHNPVLFNFFLTYSLPNNNGKFATNWNLFTTTLNKLDLQNPYCIGSPSQLDEYVRNIESQINHARVAASKPIKPNTIYVDARLKELSAERNYARKTFQSTRSPVLKRYLNKINKQINKLDQKVEINSLATEMTNVNTEDGTIWKFVRPFKKKYKKIPPLISLAGIANTDTEKANCLANSLEAQFTVNYISHPDTEETVNDSATCFRLEISPDNQMSGGPLFPSEIQNCIKNLKNNKSPGLDRFSNKMIKNLPKRFLFIITTIIHKPSSIK